MGFGSNCVQHQCFQILTSRCRWLVLDALGQSLLHSNKDRYCTVFHNYLWGKRVSIRERPKSGQDTYFCQYRSATRDGVDCRVFPVGSKPSELPNLIPVWRELLVTTTASRRRRQWRPLPTNSLCNEVWRSGTIVHGRV
jgi:hypothetical protein